MSATRVFVARLAGCSVFDPAGDRVGKVRDVIVVYRKSDAPSVVGLLVEIPGKRRVFLSIGRVTSIGSGQIITTGLINLRRFEQRGGEVRVIAELLGRRMMFRDGSGEATIEDVAIEESAPAEWSVGDLFLRRPATTPFGKGATVFATWDQVREKNAPGESQSAEQLIATYSDLRPADLANTLLDLPEERRLEVAEELPDERLADALEEMPEQEQVELISQLDDERAAEVLDQMEPDDAADLIAQLSAEKGEALLQLMQPEEAEDVRFLLSYDPETAGGLMTTEPIIVSADPPPRARARARCRDLRDAAAVRAAHRSLPRHGALPADAALPAARAPRHDPRPGPRARHTGDERSRGLAPSRELRPGLAPGGRRQAPTRRGGDH